MKTLIGINLYNGGDYKQSKLNANFSDGTNACANIHREDAERFAHNHLRLDELISYYFNSQFEHTNPTKPFNMMSKKNQSLSREEIEKIINDKVKGEIKPILLGLSKAIDKLLPEREVKGIFEPGGVIHGSNVAGVLKNEEKVKPAYLEELCLGIHPGLERPIAFSFGMFNQGDLEVNHMVIVYKGYVQSTEFPKFKLTLNDLRVLNVICESSHIEVNGHEVSYLFGAYMIDNVNEVTSKQVKTLIKALKKQQK